MNHKIKNLAAILLIGVVLAVLPFVVGSQFGNAWVRTLDFALLYVMLALGLNIVVGYAGLLDLGYIAFYAVGAYFFALLNSPHLAAVLPAWALHLPIWVVLPLGALLACLFGVILGAPTLKLRGDYLAIVTLGFGEIIRLFLNNLDSPVNITNGPKGISMIDPVTLFGHPLSRSINLFGIDIPGLYLYYYFFLALALLIMLVSVRLQDSRIGRAWVAIREDEIAAAAMGINTRNIKLAAFAFGALTGGLAGGLFAAMQGFVSPESFGLLESVMILAMVVLGGMGHIPGVILGAVLLAAMPEVIRYAADERVQHNVFGTVLIAPEVLRNLIFSLAMILIMLFKPAGLWPSPEKK